MSEWKKYDETDFADLDESPAEPPERRPEVAEEDMERFEAVKEEAARKTDRIFVMNQLDEARLELDYWQKNREKVIQLDEALSRTDLKEVARLLARFSYESNELAGDQKDERKSDRENKEKEGRNALLNIVRNIYEQRGTDGLRKFASLHINRSGMNEPLKNGTDIDTVISKAEAEVKRISEIIHNNSLEDAAHKLYRFGDCPTIWDIKQRVLKEEYGIDWLTPDERFPDIDFD